MDLTMRQIFRSCTALVPCHAVVSCSVFVVATSLSSVSFANCDGKKMSEASAGGRVVASNDTNEKGADGAKAELTEGPGVETLKIPRIHCDSCKKNIVEALETKFKNEIEAMSVIVKDQKLLVKLKPGVSKNIMPKIRKLLEEKGYPATT